MDKISKNNVAVLNLEEIAKERFPDKKIPALLMKFLKKIVREEGLNDLYRKADGRKNMDFIDVAIDYFDVKCNVVCPDNLPSDGRPAIFVCNHPLGAMDAVCLAYVLGHRYDGKIKFYANEFLTLVEPLKEMFLPIYKYGSQGKNNLELIRNFYESDMHLLTFPAGATSRKHGDRIIDLEWQKNFIKKSTEYKRDVVPLYFDARNSKFFYLFEKFRELIRAKVNFEMILLPDELFKQQGNTFTLYVGKPIVWQTFDETKSRKEWAAYVKNIVYELPFLH